MQSVISDEGFWVGDSTAHRVLVQLVGPGESSIAVRQGQQLFFTGRMVPNPPGFAGQIGVAPTEAAVLLEREGYHVEVPMAGIREG